MKLKYKIFSIFLSFSFFFISIFNSSTIVYAKTYYSWNEFIKDSYTFITYIASQIGAVCSSDFAQWIQNKDSWDNYWNEDNITFDNDNGNVTFSDDLVNYIKQALKEYAEETNGYMILPSIHFSTISTSSFGSSYQYQTAKALVNKYGLVSLACNKSKYMYVKGVSEYLNNNAGFYVDSEFSTSCFINLMNFISWEYINIPDNSLTMSYNFEKVIHDWDEAESSASPSDGLYYYSGSSISSSYGNIIIYKPGYAVFDTGSDGKLVSKDGRNILVFKSKEALQNYSVDHRSVYFGSKFYEDSGAVTGTYDDLQDWLDGKYDDFFDKLKDLLPEGSNLSEDDLEKIVDKLLDQLDEIGDKIEQGNQETNSLLQQILAALDNLDKTIASSLSGVKFDTSGIEKYLSSILDSLGSIKNDLDDILYKLDEIAEDEVDDKSDALAEELSVPFSEVVDVLKTKFPFSIPDDIKGLFIVLNGGKEPGLESLNERLESYSINSYSDKDSDPEPDSKLFDLIVYSDWNSGVDSDGNIEAASYMDFDSNFNPDFDEDPDNGIALYAHEENPEHGTKPDPEHVYISMDKYGAPIFRFPFVIKSYGFSSELVISMSRFRSVANLARRLFLLIFLQQLMLLSIKIFDFMKGMIE